MTPFEEYQTLVTQQKELIAQQTELIALLLKEVKLRAGHPVTILGSPCPVDLGGKWWIPPVSSGTKPCVSGVMP